MKTLTYDEFKQAAASIAEQAPFELYLRIDDNGIQHGHVPYIMNDSMECYMVLENCRVVGTIDPDYRGKTALEFADHTMGISVRQSENVYTAWFTGIRLHIQLYRYHEIGHFWADGQEQWRRLVYMVGTIYDKIKYAPQRSFTTEEANLSYLMEFAPFRVWSPINDSILSLYPETEEGARAFAALAEEAGCHSIARSVRRYAKHPGWMRSSRIASWMIKPAAIPLYNLILRKVSEASEVYPARDYGTARNARMQAERDKVTMALYDEGFSGKYPLFRRPGMEVLVAEEHPFTTLEDPDYTFRLNFMISEYPKEYQPQGVCNGFFKKRGFKGYVYVSKTNEQDF